MKKVGMGYYNKAEIDTFLLNLLRHKMLAITVLFAKNRERTQNFLMFIPSKPSVRIQI